ncbi:IS3 family transposase [Actinomyces qiguomingii]|uniref:IS3 family transposase n=1 Tax=Actinomyces qiguomingii TaxID=2057800 RepID=UPI000CA035EF|nr:IS3 family transposase [Actinomyces qiguomingii]
MTTRYELIRREEGNYPIAWMCQWAMVSKSGYYNWLSRHESATAIRRKELSVLIEKIFDESDGTYGYRRVAATLDWQGVPADPDAVRSIMCELDLKAAQPRRRVHTTVPAEGLAERPDLLGRDFTADTPGLGGSGISPTFLLGWGCRGSAKSLTGWWVVRGFRRVGGGAARPAGEDMWC